ncbi:hypothetical protein TanjilG_28652 [Lupinus angustifolius]|uniref:Glycosyltransferase n=1 Tax=Lupinus angustifolius TaxID=3871 RepID=A0A4P1RP32_LUPAN|nr:PREDICTED: anthocyanidin 3-O-glucoside 2''-O-glucosyltransferase-like [Lupinus angustifolius]OIW15453.1 hypothetical protein TanjilG_28652 [Lupinus angustifolius]
MGSSSIHIAMYPWLAMGHLTVYLHLANKLANKGNKVSIITPKGTISKLSHFNHFPNLITFVPITVPHVQGLPHGAETTLDIPFSLNSLLMTAFDNTQKEIELLLVDLKPSIVFFDTAFWLPNLTRNLGVKCVTVLYWVISSPSASFVEYTVRKSDGNSEVEFPGSSIKLHAHEARAMDGILKKEFGSGISFYERIKRASTMADAMGFKGCREIEGPSADYIANVYKKPVLLSGPILPEQQTSALEEKWALWLGKFKAGSVVFVALGSEWELPQNQFQELVLGLELTGLPFLAALKAPPGFESVEAALPDGFKERVQGRGIVHGGWVQQTLILQHLSIGCFITHCGSGSIVEALVSQCQLVFLPHILDHIITARLISTSFKAGVEIQRGEEDGLFSKESVSEAVKTVMDEENDVGKEIKVNHNKLRSLLLSEDLESTYVDNFYHKLLELLG